MNTRQSRTLAVSAVYGGAIAVSPWTFGMPLTILNTEPVMPYECHEGNIGLKDMLEVARAHDRDAR